MPYVSLHTFLSPSRGIYFTGGGGGGSRGRENLQKKNNKTLDGRTASLNVLLNDWPAAGNKAARFFVFVFSGALSFRLHEYQTSSDLNYFSIKQILVWVRYSSDIGRNRRAVSHELYIYIFIFRLSRFPVYRGSGLGRFYCMK
jgi:hypothetical protein